MTCFHCNVQGSLVVTICIDNNSRNETIKQKMHSWASAERGKGKNWGTSSCFSMLRFTIALCILSLCDHADWSFLNYFSRHPWLLQMRVAYCVILQIDYKFSWWWNKNEVLGKVFWVLRFYCFITFIDVVAMFYFFARLLTFQLFLGCKCVFCFVLLFWVVFRDFSISQTTLAYPSRSFYYYF